MRQSILVCLALFIALPAVAAERPPERRDRHDSHIPIRQRLAEILGEVSAIESMIDRRMDREERRQVRKRLNRLQQKLTRLLSVVPEKVRRIGTPPPTPPPAPAPEPVEEGPVAMKESAFSGALSSVRKASFARDKLAIIEMIAKENWFLVSHVSRVIAELSFDRDKLRAIELMAPHILDRNNRFKLYDAFSFSSSKKKLKAILK